MNLGARDPVSAPAWLQLPRRPYLGTLTAGDASAGCRRCGRVDRQTQGRLTFLICSRAPWQPVFESASSERSQRLFNFP